MAERPRNRDVIKAYVALTKPRIIELLLTTTLPAMFLAYGGVPNLWLVFFTLVGGALAAGSANVLNCILDRDIDEAMPRTRRRPMPRHQVPVPKAYAFAAVLGVISTLVLGFGANWLSAILAVAANAFYIFVYTLWLKRRTPQNIIWGGIAGCFPPLIGWTAVTNSLTLTPFVLFGIVFFWTPPHTWALAIRYRFDYKVAGVPMLPVVRDSVNVAWQIFGFAVATVATSLLLWPVAQTGWLYPLVAAAFGVVFIYEAILLLRRSALAARACGQTGRGPEADAAVPLDERLPSDRVCRRRR